MCFTGVAISKAVPMSKASRKFKVPDQLANLYDFANSLDVRHFTHHGVPHVQADELGGPRELGAWMAQRGLLFTGARITPAMLDTALQLRASVRTYLQCNPAERRENKGAVQSLNAALMLCAAEECRRVFFDRSKPATRRWCMSTLCGNRMKTRAYRERHRDAG